MHCSCSLGCGDSAFNYDWDPNYQTQPEQDELLNMVGRQDSVTLSNQESR